VAISVKSKTEYTKIKSTRFLCAKCLAFMIEWTPVIKRAMVGGMRRHVKEDLDGIFPTVWFQCPNGDPYGVHGMLDIRSPKARRILGQHGTPPEKRIRAR
jgi:hypothetical protein